MSLPSENRADLARRVHFAHESERRVTELFDHHGIHWEYEPVEFVLAWGPTGDPTSAFRPDFYLREHNLFIELTTLRQRLVTRKNRKLRRLRELYPEVQVKMLYRRDYLDLLAGSRFSFLTDDERDLSPPRSA